MSDSQSIALIIIGTVIACVTSHQFASRMAFRSLCKWARHTDHPQVVQILARHPQLSRASAKPRDFRKALSKKERQAIEAAIRSSYD